MNSLYLHYAEILVLDAASRVLREAAERTKMIDDERYTVEAASFDADMTLIRLRIDKLLLNAETAGTLAGPMPF